MANRTGSIPHSGVEVCAAQLRLLESLFPEGWFKWTDEAAHPALQRWKLLKAMVDSGGTRYPDVDTQPDSLCLLAELLLDGSLMMTALGGRLANLDIGDLTAYGDQKVRERVRKSVANPIHFLSIVTELSRAAWHTGQGHTVRAFEEPGVADLVVRVPGFDIPLVVECKHIGADTNIENLSVIVRKANTQIKNHGLDGYGLAVIDITDRARCFIRRFTPRGGYRHYTPPEMTEAERELRRILYANNTAVGGAALLWNEIRLRPEGAKFRLVINKKVRFVAHRAPLRRIPDDLVVLIEQGAGAISLRLAPALSASPTA